MVEYSPELDCSPVPVWRVAASLAGEQLSSPEEVLARVLEEKQLACQVIKPTFRHTN